MIYKEFLAGHLANVGLNREVKRPTNTDLDRWDQVRVFKNSQWEIGIITVPRNGDLVNKFPNVGEECIGVAVFDIPPQDIVDVESLINRNLVTQENIDSKLSFVWVANKSQLRGIKKSSQYQ